MVQGSQELVFAKRRQHSRKKLFRDKTDEQRRQQKEEERELREM